MYLREDRVVHMIFGASPARPSRRREKLFQREVLNTDTTKPSYLKWSEVPITFDHKDHPGHVPQLGTYPLVVAPLFKSKRIHKVLMDGGSGINILYASTLDNMGPAAAVDHTVVPAAAVDHTVPQGCPRNGSAPHRADRSAHHVRGLAKFLHGNPHHRSGGWGSRGCTMRSLGGRHTRSLWSCPTIRT
jgi:hypothetical protein